jgi:hypothetical protein
MIVGTVLWQGDVPKLDDFPIDKNGDVCCRDAQQCLKREDGTLARGTERLVVDAETKGVRNAVVSLEDMQGKGRPLAALGAEPLRLDQRFCRYQPRILILPKDGKVQMTSADNTLHNIHMYGAGTYNLAFGNPSVQFVRPFKKLGLVRVVCDAGHAWMTAYIHVVEHPYYAVTNEQGQFELRDVPPGNYQLTLWHEGWKVVGHEKDSAGLISRYYFSEAVVLHKEVEVKAGTPAEVQWELSNEVADGFTNREVPGP